MGSGAVAGGDSGMPAAESALREALFTRSYEGEKFGRADLDILYWWTTRHLLKEPSHSTAVHALDEFIAGHGEKSMRDPLRRALLQRDLWQLFDWAAGSKAADAGNDYARERAALRARIATAMKRLALTPQQINRLPDNLEGMNATADIADFPRGLLDDSGDWVMVGTSGEEVAAPFHVHDFRGHSNFLVLVRLPGGRQETLAYLKKLREIAPEGDVQKLANLPDASFPAGTLWAVVRSMNIIDTDGRFSPTHLVESVQMRRYIVVPPPDTPGTLANQQAHNQDFFEIRLDRSKPPQLVVIDDADRSDPFVHFRTQGVDEFELGNGPPRIPTLRSCQQCHGMPGLLSVQSYVQFQRRPTPANVLTDFASEATKTAEWKQKRPDWQELSRLWQKAR
jgi:hypothetical protein